MQACEKCGGTEQVRFGLCLDCTRTAGKGAKAKARAKGQVPKAPPLEPPHSRPWIHRGGG